MDSYTFTDPGSGRRFTIKPDSFEEGLLAIQREALRLAQRVQELEALIAGHDRQVDHLRLKAAAFDSSEREREALVKRVQALEGELRSALASCNTTEMARLDTLQHLRMAEIARDKAKAAAKEWHQEAIDRAVNLRHEESKGRQYCLELAEKAEEIRQLKDRVRELELDRADARKVAEAFRVVDAEEIRGLRETCVMLNRQTEETLRLADDRLDVMKRLRTAVDEAIAHVEAARETSIELESDESGCKLITQQLDLAREALAAGKDRTRTTARMNTADARMLAAEAARRFQDRVAALEGAVEQLQKLEIKRGLDAREGKA